MIWENSQLFQCIVLAGHVSSRKFLLGRRDLGFINKKKLKKYNQTLIILDTNTIINNAGTKARINGRNNVDERIRFSQMHSPHIHMEILTCRTTESYRNV